MKSFPGYKYEFGKSTYRGEEVGEGGLVRAIPGMYTGRVVCFDVASMHPSSIVALNLFGPYTGRFKELMDARLAIKHGDLEKAKTLMDGKLAPYLNDTSEVKDLAYALKIVINIVYGLTSAKFQNPFNDVRNKDNIVAKRGALFMMDLRHELRERFGVEAIHIKTDSIKIEDPSPEVSSFISSFGEEYGYTFEVEDVFDKFCLVNHAVYIAHEEGGSWHAVGAQFAEPYVFKTLFSKEPLEFSDHTVQKSVTTSLHLRKGDQTRFVGKTGLFVPVEDGSELLREKDGKLHAATGTKGWLWEEAEVYQANPENYKIDARYFKKLVDDALATLQKHGDAEAFLG